MTVRITKRTVDACKPTDKDNYVWDAELSGFGLKVSPLGRKTYLVQYRLGGRSGKTRRLTIGQHGSPWTPPRARKQAELILAQLSLGQDPAEEKTKSRKATRISELADRYLTEHVQVHNKPSTLKEVARIIETRIKPELGSLAADRLTRSRIKSWHQAMHETPYEANRALAYLSKLMSLAATDWEVIANNPCIGMKRFPEQKRSRFFDGEELGRIGRTLDTAERGEEFTPSCVLAVRLLALTGLRLGEVLTLKWKDIDLTGGLIRLVDTKTGDRISSLSESVAKLLEKTEKAGPYVVFGSNPLKPLPKTTFYKFWKWIQAEADLGDARPHDFRHTAGTYAAQAGFNAFMIRDYLGHKTVAMTNRYVERANDPARITANTVADRIASSMTQGD